MGIKPGVDLIVHLLVSFERILKKVRCMYVLKKKILREQTFKLRKQKKRERYFFSFVNYICKTVKAGKTSSLQNCPKNLQVTCKLLSDSESSWASSY